MSSRSHDIVDLKEKIALLLRHKVNGIKTQTELAELSGIDKAVINRWLNPTKVGLRDFEKLCEVLKDTVPSELWEKPIEEFADTLELVYEAPQRTVSSPAVLADKVGIDFESRIKDRKVLEKRFEIMKGYWEVISYSISVTTQKCVLFQLMEIESLNDNGYIEFSMYGGHFYHHGYCFFVAGMTNFVLEELKLLNEMGFMITNSPDRAFNPILTGVLLCLTGGAQELVPTPSAAKVVLRHCDSLNILKEKYNVHNSAISMQEITEEIRISINSNMSQLSDILPFIDNHVPQDAIPYTLRAKFF